MDPEPPDRYHAPADAPREHPRVDDQLVRPETREELVRGRAVVAAPAKEPHAERHYELDYVTRASVAEGYVGASDLLTRVGLHSDFATDACIRREGIDPTTGARYLEELAFEVVSEQSRRDMTERAEDLTARGVRRIIAIFVKKGDVCEWRDGDWVRLDPAGVLDDPTLAQPLPIRALLDRAEADRAVVQALHAKREPTFVALEAQSFEQGFEKGTAQASRTAIEALCDVLEIPLDPERRAKLQTLDAAGLAVLLQGLRTERRWP